MDAFQGRNVHQSGTVAADQQPGGVQLLRQRQEAAFGNRLGAPFDTLAAFEQLAHEPMRLQLLQHVVHRELDVAVVETDDHPERQHVLAHRVDERAAELSELRSRTQRPAHRVDDAVELAFDLPDLFDSERPDLRVLAGEAKAVERDAGEVSLRPFGEDRDLRDQIRARLEVAERLTVASATLVAGPDTACPPVRDEELLRRRLRQEHHAGFLCLLGEPAAQSRQRGDVIALVLHRRRRGNAQRVVLRQEIDRLVLDGPVKRHLVDPLASLEQAAQRTRVDDGAGEEMRADLLALLQHRNRNLAQPLADLRRSIQQLAEPNCARKPCGTGPHDQDADLYAFVLRIARRGDVVRSSKRRRKICGLGHDALRALTSSVSFGTTSCTSPTTPRSENSKMGAFVSLLMATITPEPCMPTLCWIAPEMPHAM